MTPLLVIGYGNELRGDDGAGPSVARIVDSWGRADVRAIAVHQLTPELAPLLAEAERVVFVDAAVDDSQGWQPVELSPQPSCLGHTSDPGWLLALTAELYGRVPEARLATIPARRIGFETELTAESGRDVMAVLTAIAELITTPTPPPPSSRPRPART